MRPRIVFFDIETRKWASDLRPDDIEAGWDELRAGKGGASAIAVYDTLNEWLYTYDDHEAEACALHVEAADIVVGFCSDTFDIPCLEGLIHRRMRISQSYDIYAEMVRACTSKGIPLQKGDLKLDHLSKRNLGRGKIEHGANARELARTGRWGRLFRYCGDDVHLTRDLYYKILADGGLVGPRGFISLPTRPQ